MIVHSNIHSCLNGSLTETQVRRLGDLWGTKLHTNITDGIMEPWTAALLAAFLGARMPSDVLELGTSTGVTTALLIAVLRDVSGLKQAPTRLVSVDNDLRQDIARENLAKLAGPDLILVQEDSLKFLRECEPDSFDVAILDDGHALAHVKEEIKLARNAVRNGGTLLIHDTHSRYDLAPLVRMEGGVCFPTVPVHMVGAGLGIIEVLK